MPTKLKTEWKRIGRSGPAVDGRTIDPQWLRDAAETYNPDVYKALIWPDHQRWFNMGGIEALRIEENDEGGIDLFAQLSPNQFYLDINKNGQRLFTSMELQEDFRDTGKHYLTGLGATDNPASAATTEVRFSRIAEPGIALGMHTENTTHEFDDSQATDERVLNRLLSFFQKSNEDDMNKKTIEQLQAQMTALTAKFNQAFPGDKAPETAAAGAGHDAGKEPGTAEEFNALKAEIADLKKQVETFTAKDKTDTEKTVSVETVEALKTELSTLTESFNAALQEQPGTDGGDHLSGDDDLNQYI